jgi:mannose-6-phosphate isomerase-like protein (cupin superfamily)
MSDVLIKAKPAGVPDFAKSSQDLHDALESKIQEGKPSFFKLKAQLPKLGRTNVPMASSSRMWITLKTYAHDGENELHAHPNEDHMFVVLQGQASFRGPNGEEKMVGKHEGVLLPHGTFYWFKAVTEEPLVMVRVGCAAFEGDDKGKHGRINIEGKPMLGDSAENKSVKPIMTEKWFG